MAGQLTNRPVNGTCGAKNQVTFLDWRYVYTQPLQYIKWELVTYDEQFIKTIGTINNATGSLVPNMEGRHVHLLNGSKYYEEMKLCRGIPYTKFYQIILKMIFF